MIALVALGGAFTGCAAEEPRADGPAIVAPPAGLAGSTAPSPTPSVPTAIGGTGGLGVGDAGRSVAGAGAGGAGPAGTGGAGMGGSGGSAVPMEGVDPSDVELTAIAANGTIGLDWSRVAGATGYRLYWGSAAGVTLQSGTAIDVAEPAYVHRGLTNGSAYHYVVTAVLASGEGPPSPEASATPGGEWVLEQLGTGDFDDIITGARVPRVPLERRVQVFLLPEGYLAGELAGFHDHATHGAGSSDVDRWIDDVLSLDPYPEFQEAFVIWYLPRASSAHVGAGDTAFDVTVSGGGVQEVMGAAAPLWSALDNQGSDAFAFPAGAGQPRNFVAAFLIFDPERGRAGFSGLTTSLRNPAVQNQQLRAAFALGHPHEFTHAFARVGDEYMETSNNAPSQMSESYNISPSNRCDELPWAHLLEGRGINTTAELVGAFGSPELGYHSELHCQMNGTHDNGQFWCEPADERYTSLTLRPDRFCNYCRELIAYRVFERTQILAGDATGFETWKSMYRMPFWERFGFVVPEMVPQTVQCNRNGPMLTVYEACMP